MYRSLLLRAAAAASLVSAPIPPMREIQDAGVISRLLGGADTFGTIADFTAILDKAKGAKVPQARIGRAVALLRRGDLGHAMADLDAAVAETKGDKTGLHALAVAVRTAVRNQQLDNAESQATISGAVEESTLSTLRELVKADIAELRSVSPDCWTIQLAEAEYQLYNGNAATALPQLRNVHKAIKQEIARRRVMHTSPAATEAELEATIAYAFNRTLFCESANLSDIKSSIVSETAKHHVKATAALTDGVASLRKKIGVESLTDVEVARLAGVSAAARASHHYYRMFPLDEKYDTWHSPAAEALKEKIRHFYHPRSISGFSAKLSAIQKPDAPVSNGKSAEEVKKALSSVPQGANVIDHLESILGAGATSALSSGDHAFHDALTAVDEAAAQHPSPFSTGSAHQRYQDTFIVELLEQAAFRVELDEALCLERMNKLEEAKAKLDGIVTENKFLYMWKALLARGRVLKALGKIDEGEEDFKTLHSLKRTVGVDIPQLDANRYKSTF